MLTTNTIKMHYDDGDGVKVTFYDNDTEIGKACTCDFDGKPNSFLHSFEVKPKYRGKGYGTQILKYMIKKYDVDTLYVSKTNKAVNLYQRFGFKHAGEFNKDIIVMKRHYLGSKESAIITKNELYSVMSHLYDVAMEGYSSNKAAAFYRITYNGIGVYQALKENITMDEWKRILNSGVFKWLPKPPESTYGTSGEFRSYFTEAGYNKFNQLVMPVIYKYLDENKIKIETFTDVTGIVYRDRYQVVCGTTKPKRK